MPRKPTSRDRVMLTGMTQDELRTVRRREEASGTRCYLCKRRHGEPSLAIRVPGHAGDRTFEEVDDNLFRITPSPERSAFVDAVLDVQWVRVHDDETAEYLVPLCQECSMLIDRWPDR